MVRHAESKHGRGKSPHQAVRYRTQLPSLSWNELARGGISRAARAYGPERATTTQAVDPVCLRLVSQASPGLLARCWRGRRTIPPAACDRHSICQRRAGRSSLVDRGFLPHPRAPRSVEDTTLRGGCESHRYSAQGPLFFQSMALQMSLWRHAITRPRVSKGELQSSLWISPRHS